MEIRMLNAIGSLSIVTAYDFITLLVENMRVSTSKETELRNRVSEKAISKLHQSVLFKELIELKPSALALRWLNNAFRDLATDITSDKENLCFDISLPSTHEAAPSRLKRKYELLTNPNAQNGKVPENENYEEQLDQMKSLTGWKKGLTELNID
jgi:hypothetical protein